MNDTQTAGGQPLALAIEGMTCGHCKARVETTLAALAGVQAYEVDLGSAAARLRHQPARTSAADIAAAVTAAGYPARVVEG